MDEIRDYIARAKSAQAAHDERPGTQLALDIYAQDFTPITNSNHDDDPADCTDHRGA